MFFVPAQLNLTQFKVSSLVILTTPFHCQTHFNVYEDQCQVCTDTGCEDPISVSEYVYKYKTIVVNIFYTNQ